jgi:16S rRNA (adenine1518-N6/adenine1519-N6)-dimethyltransferase
VRSALLQLTFRPPLFELLDPALFQQMVRSMFTQRRKTLANALGPFAEQIGALPAQALAAAGIDPRRRPETLEVIEIARLADIFAAARR